jgi:hypothetical protein
VKDAGRRTGKERSGRTISRVPLDPTGGTLINFSNQGFRTRIKGRFPGEGGLLEQRASFIRLLFVFYNLCYNRLS